MKDKVVKSEILLDGEDSAFKAVSDYKTFSCLSSLMFLN